jgi:hypothetical protein
LGCRDDPIPIKEILDELESKLAESKEKN